MADEVSTVEPLIFEGRKGELEGRRRLLLEHLVNKPGDRQACFAILRIEQTLYDWLRMRDAEPEWEPPTAKTIRRKGTAGPQRTGRQGSTQVPERQLRRSEKFSPGKPIPPPKECGGDSAKGRAWTSPAYVRVRFDGPMPDGRKPNPDEVSERRRVALSYFKRFVTSDVDVVFRRWAAETFGSVSEALAQLQTLCQIVEPKAAGRSNARHEEAQIARLVAAAGAWEARLNCLKERDLLGSETETEIKSLMCKCIDLQRDWASLDVQNRRKRLDALLSPTKDSPTGNVVTSIAGKNMARRGERKDTILAVYREHFHDPNLRSGDTIVKFIQARVQGYVSGLNGDQPLAEFPYLSRFDNVDPKDRFIAYLSQYVAMDEGERLKRPEGIVGATLRKGERRSPHLERLMKLYHAAFSCRTTGTAQHRGWGNRTLRSGALAELNPNCPAGFYLAGEADKTEWAVMLWHKNWRRPVLLLATGEEEFAVSDLCQLDGTALSGTICKGLKVKNGRGKGLLLSLKIGHDFRRWWRSNISNDDPGAPAYRRAVMKSFKLRILDPDDKPNKPSLVFIQPSFQFNEGDRKPNVATIGTSNSSIRWLVGIDWGITFPIYAAVLDIEEPDRPKVVRVEAVNGQSKIEHARLAIAQIARANYQLASAIQLQKPADLDSKKWRRLREARIAKARTALRVARAALRAVNAFDVVEATSRLVAWIDEDEPRIDPLRQSVSAVPPDDFAFVIEDLKRPVVNDLKRVQTLLRFREALKHQLRRRGFPARPRHRRGFPYGMEEVDARGTSRIGLSGWERSDKPTLNEDLPYGREVGKYVDRDMASNAHQRGRRKQIGPSRNVFKAAGQSDGDTTRHRDFGQQLFWDPCLKEWSNKRSEHGWVLPADFIAAVNIALRQVAISLIEQQKHPGRDDRYDALVKKRHQELLNALVIDCHVPAWKPIVEGERLTHLIPIDDVQ